MIPPASTGRDSTSRKEVMSTDQMNSGMRNMVIPFGRMFRMVTIMLIEPRIEEAPARCILRMARSTDGPAWPLMPDRGGYMVQPVPAPSRKVEESRR